MMHAMITKSTHTALCNETVYIWTITPKFFKLKLHSSSSHNKFTSDNVNSNCSRVGSMHVNYQESGADPNQLSSSALFRNLLTANYLQCLNLTTNVTTRLSTALYTLNFDNTDRLSTKRNLLQFLLISTKLEGSSFGPWKPECGS